MYISPTVAKIIGAVFLALIFYADHAISNIEEIPEKIRLKLRNSLFVVVVIGVVLAACFGR